MPLIKNIAKFCCFKMAYPLAYHISALRKINKGKIVFAQIRSGVLTDSFKYIFEEISANAHTEPEIYFVHNNKGGLGYLWRYFVLCLKIGNAGCVLLDDTCNLFGAFRFRKNTKVVQTWHSCGAFKKWGESITDLSFGENAEELHKYPAHTSYTLVTVSSQECVWAFKEAFGFSSDNDCVKPVGISRTDFFFNEDNKKLAFDTLYGNYPSVKGKKIILYAPTFRGDADKAYIPEKLDIGMLCDNFGENFVLLVKRHGFVHKTWDIPEACKDFCFDVSDNMKIENLLFVSDICITDYSSLIFEYSLFEKPMIFYAFDLDEFYDYRGFYYKYDNDFLPGDIVKDNVGLVESLKRACENTDINKIRQFREKFMGACDGHATERICDYILKN